MIDMNDLMKKAQELSQNMQKQQEELAQLTFDVSVGGEMVKMKFNGKMELLEVEIDYLTRPKRLERLASSLMQLQPPEHPPRFVSLNQVREIQE